MKVLAATLVTLLLMAAFSLSKGIEGVPTTCCMTYQQKPIPLRLINSTYPTSSHCHLPGVIFVTQKGKALCANPQAPWVQERLKHFQTPKN